jgi:hypothetical protein
MFLILGAFALGSLVLWLSFGSAVRAASGNAFADIAPALAARHQMA